MEVDESETVSVESQIDELDTASVAPWDGIQDALDPVRQMVFGPEAIVPSDIYEHYRDSKSRVISRVAPLRSRRPWAFFAITAVAHGAPRWMIIEPGGSPRCVTDLNEVAMRLRALLAEDPPERSLDPFAVRAMDRFLDEATQAERELLPRRMLRALELMSNVLNGWAAAARRAHEEVRATEWLDLEIALVSASVPMFDPYLVAERWLALIAPALEAQRKEMRRRRYILLRDVEPRLIREPLDYESVFRAFVDLPPATPLDERVSACVIGVPDPG
jgi:hypothetical protein